MHEHRYPSRPSPSQPIDVLINNAGRLRRDSLSQPDDEEVMSQFVVNAVGPLRLTRALLPLMSSGSKVAHITSRMGSIADNTSGGMYGYRMSKAALNAAAKSMTVDLAPKGIAIAILHPGFVRTGMTGGNGLVDPPESAAGLIARIDELTQETSGTFWHMNGDVLPGRETRNTEEKLPLRALALRCARRHGSSYNQVPCSVHGPLEKNRGKKQWESK